MKIHSINAEQKLAGIVSSINHNPSSWQGWHVLHVDVCEDTNANTSDEALLWIEAILNSYLKDVEGQTYFCHGHSAHAVCKSVPYDVLAQAGEHICDLLMNEGHLLAEYKVYNLGMDGLTYVSNSFSKDYNILSMPTSDAQHDERAVKHTVKNLGQHWQEKQILNPEDYAKVLLVEDDPVTRWMVQNSLKNECQFTAVPTASQAFSQFQAIQPDIVFLDIGLPDQNGTAVLEWIMRNDPGVCVVMFSSNDNLNVISEALEGGASGFIAKPFLKEQLLHYIHGHSL